MSQRPTPRTGGRHTVPRTARAGGARGHGDRLAAAGRGASRTRDARGASSRSAGDGRSASARRAREQRRRTVRILLIAFLTTVLVGVAAVAVLHEEEPASVATASPTLTAPVPIELDMTGWDATRIIDDDVFFDATTMNEEQVAALIAKVNTGCRAGRGGTPCLADATFTTADVAATTYCPGGYEGAQDEPAAAVVSKVAASCDVNPQVLLTLLQKEQGLLTASGAQLTASDYEIATGYGCPDGSDCDPQYEGFFNQVYGAASQFQHYRLSPGSFEVVAGQPADVAYSPDSSCGSASLTVQNEATAGLYNYTPYQPDAAAADGGDECTSWGNWNFYGFFRALFGDPTPSA